MFIEIFELLLSFMTQIFDMFKRIEFFPGFSLFSLAVALFFLPVVGFLLNFVLGKDSD